MPISNGFGRVHLHRLTERILEAESSNKQQLESSMKQSTESFNKHPTENLNDQSMESSNKHPTESFNKQPIQSSMKHPTKILNKQTPEPIDDHRVILKPIIGNVQPTYVYQPKPKNKKVYTEIMLDDSHHSEDEFKGRCCKSVGVFLVYEFFYSIK